MTLLAVRSATLVRGGRTLFEDLTLTIAAGEAVMVRGPNGAGKSSLLRLAAGLLEPAKGTVERSTVALADDRLALDRERRLRDALKFWTGDDPDPALSSLGLDGLADVPVRFLSSGQAKRASLARVVASSARLWLLDEPLNALDNDGCHRLATVVERHRHSGGAVLAASHSALSGDWRQLRIGE